MKLERISLNLTADSAGGTHGRHPPSTGPRSPASALRSSLPIRRSQPRQAIFAPRVTASWIGSAGSIEIATSVHAVVRAARAQARDKRETKHTKHTKHTAAQTLKTPGPPCPGYGRRRRASAGVLARSGARRQRGDLVRSGSRRPEGFIRAAHDLLKAGENTWGVCPDALVAIDLSSSRRRPRCASPPPSVVRSVCERLRMGVSGNTMTSCRRVADVASAGSEGGPRVRDPVFGVSVRAPPIVRVRAVLAFHRELDRGRCSLEPPRSPARKRFRRRGARGGGGGRRELCARCSPRHRYGRRHARRASAFLADNQARALGAPRASGATRGWALAVAEIPRRARRGDGAAGSLATPARRRRATSAGGDLLRAHAPRCWRLCGTRSRRARTLPAKSVDDTKMDVDDNEKTDVDDTKTDVDETTNESGRCRRRDRSPETAPALQTRRPTGSRKASRRLAPPPKRPARASSSRQAQTSREIEPF